MGTFPIEVYMTTVTGETPPPRATPEAKLFSAHRGNVPYSRVHIPNKDAMEIGGDAGHKIVLQ